MEPTQLIAANNQNVWERFERFRNNSGGKTTVAAASVDSFTPSNKDKNKDNIKKYSIIGIGTATAIGTIVAVIKRKQIGKFFSNLFKKTKDVEPPQRPKVEESVITPQKVEEPAVITPPKPRYEIPEPKFSCGAENPVQFAKEKDKYVTELINGVSLYNDEDYALGTIKAFNKYSSKDSFEELGVETNHLQSLGMSLRVMKTKSDKVLNSYLKTYVQHGKPSALDVAKIPLADSQILKGLFDKYHDVMSKDSALLMIEGFKKTGCTYSDILKTGSFQKELYMKRFSPEEFNKIKTAAQDAIDTIKKRGYIT